MSVHFKEGEVRLCRKAGQTNIFPFGPMLIMNTWPSRQKYTTQLNSSFNIKHLGEYSKGHNVVVISKARIAFNIYAFTSLLHCNSTANLALAC